MRVFILAVILLPTLLLPVRAGAVPLITFTQGVYATPVLPNVRTIQNFDTAPDGGTPYVPGAGEATTGNVRVFSTTLPETAVDPYTVPGNHYLSIINGSYSVMLDQAAGFFSFVLGSLDNYNVLTLRYSDGTSQSLTGRQIIGDSSPGPVNSAVSGRVNYDFTNGPGLVKATFSSGTPSFEIDDIVATVPEPAAWAMMMLGVAMAGASLRRLRATTPRLWTA